MNIQSTPSQRLFYAAHKERMAKFWPKRVIEPVAEVQPPVVAEPIIPPIRREMFDLAWEILEPTARDSITIEIIKREVCLVAGITRMDIESTRRHKRVVIPRQVAMNLSRHLTTRSFPEIGRRFGGRDHTTVLHAVSKIDKMIATDATIAELVHEVRARLGA